MPSTHSRHSSRTLFTAHAPKTHVKAPQTDFPAKPDNSSGPIHDSPSERPLRTKETFQPKTAPKSIEDTKLQEEHPSQARTNSPPCSFSPRVETKARRAASRPSRHPPRCPEPWRSSGSIERNPWLNASDTEAIEARFSSLSAPNPLGLGLAPLRTRDTAPRGAVLLRLSLEYPT